MLAAGQFENPLSPSTQAGLLAADVGGTHVRLGRIQHDGDLAKPIQIDDYREYRCADHPSLGAILGDFIGTGTTATELAIACAGFPREDGSVIATNLPWPVEPRLIREQLGLQAVHLVNDFEAVAHATPCFDHNALAQLSGPEHASSGPVLVIGPGTGLGAAVWIPNGNQPLVLATEAGQATLASGNLLEAQLVAQMQQQRAHVSIEQAISGPGLLNLYQTLGNVRGVCPTLTTPAQISAAALHGDDALAVETLKVFCALLGSVVGDMALTYGASSIYLAGGILPRLLPLLRESDFVTRFLNKGAMREALQNIPVKLVDHGQLGVIGAARWYFGRQF